MHTDQRTLPPRLLEKQAVTYLRDRHGVHYSPATLKRWRVAGGGPAYQKCGRKVLYSADRLDAWVAEKLGPEVRSSSEARALATA